jgi:hypothetical protein
MRRLGCLQMSGQEDWKIVALGDFDDHLFIGTLGVEVLSKLLSKQTGMRTDDTVLAGVIARRPLEDVNTDVLLGCFFGTIP